MRNKIDTGCSVVVVTGASSGFGSGVAELLASKGHRVLALARSFESEPDPNSVPKFENAPVQLRLDVTDPDACRFLAEALTEWELEVDVLINNAAVLVVGPAEDCSDEEISAVIETNLVGPIRMSRLLLPSIRRTQGRIVNVSSAAGITGVPLYSIYGASKFGLEGFSEALEREVAPFGVRVITVRPGLFRTGIQDHGRRAAAFGAASDYGAPLGRAYRRQRETGRSAADARPVIDAICEAATATHPARVVNVGSDAEFVARAAAQNPGLLRTMLTVKKPR